MKRHLQKIRRSALILALAMFLSLFGPLASGAKAYMYPATETSDLNIRTYTLGGENVGVSSSQSLSDHIGSIFPSDLITIRKASGGALQVSYPITGGTKTGWIPVSAVSRGDLNTGSSLAIRAGGSVPLFRRASGGETLGRISQNDVCYVVYTNTERAQMIIPVEGGWKLGWVSFGDMDASVWHACGGGRVIQDGTYKVFVSPSHVLDGAGADNDVHAWESLDVPQQTVAIRYENGYYSLQFSHNGYYLDVAGASSGPANVQCYPGNQSLAQKYYIADCGDGRYQLFAACSGLAVEIAYNETTSNGATCDTWQWHGQGSVTLKRLDGGQVSQSGTPASASDDGSSSAAASFQWPMQNSYCTWRTPGANRSWGSYTSNSSGRCYHLGCDLYGTGGVVSACAEGTVAAAGYNSANGKYLVIRHTLADGSAVYSFYAHLASRDVGTGQSVSAGERIGVAGSTGSSARAVHLHFALVNTLWSNGGYYGYAYRFSGDSVSFGGVIYYNPVYVIQNGRLPS